MTTSIAPLTVVHVLFSLVAILSGLVAAAGMINARHVEKWTAVFLIATVETTLTGFYFPFTKFTPAHATGLVELVVLPIAIFARYGGQLRGHWRWGYVVSAMVALYLNVFVLIAQAFMKIGPLRVLAPTQSELPFAAVQLLTLTGFVIATGVALKRFRTYQVLEVTPPPQTA